MPRTFLCLLLILFAATASDAQSAKPLLLRRPTLSRTQVAFVYAGDLWVVAREGGEARRLTAGVGVETRPYFSPDGSQIAFTGEYDGNVDVYVVPPAGGGPRPPTFHPPPDQGPGWAAHRARRSLPSPPRG